VLVSVDASLVPLTCAMLMMLRGCFEQLNLNMQVQSVCSRREVSGVITSRLRKLITPRWVCLEAVGGPVCTLTSSSMLRAGCVGDGVQLAIVASSSVGVRCGFQMLLLPLVGLLQQLLGCGSC
jgi:hypothetical protein